MKIKIEKLKKKIIDSCISLQNKKLLITRSGNVSHRWKDGMIITPSGIDYNKIKSNQIVFIDNSGKSYGNLKPSTEWQFHLDIYLHRKEINSVVHTHAPYTTGLSIIGKKIPHYHYMIAFFGGRDIRCTKFAKPGSKTLSKYILDALKNTQNYFICKRTWICKNLIRQEKEN